MPNEMRGGVDAKEFLGTFDFFFLKLGCYLFVDGSYIYVYVCIYIYTCILDTR